MPNKYGLNTNLSAEFFVASQLFRLGYIVTVTYGNTKEIDLIVHNTKGDLITIDVKGLINTTNWPIKDKSDRKNHYYILLSYKNKFLDLNFMPEVFIIPAKEIKPLLSCWSGNPKVTCIGYSKSKILYTKMHGIYYLVLNNFIVYLLIIMQLYTSIEVIIGGEVL
jgi:hypothetical protein